jgi:hypothetical protein
MDDISPLQQLSEQVMTADNHVFDVRPAIAYLNDITRTISVEGSKNFRGENPERGTAISYYLKGQAAAPVRVTISDVTGRELRSFEAPRTPGLHRVQWNMTAGGPGGGRQGGGQQAGAPAGQIQTGGQQQSGQQAAAQAAQQAAGRGGVPNPQAQQTQQQQPAAQQPAQQGRGGGGGGGRGGGGGQAVAPGSYLVKVMVGDKVIGQKTVTVEPDSTFMQ